MISMIRKPTALAAALLAIGLLGTSARADLVITVQEDAGPTQTFSVTGPAGIPTNDPFISVPFTVTTADYSISALGGEANQFVAGGFYNAILNSSTTSVVNTTGVAGVLHITITGTGFTAPTAPPTIVTDSQISGTVSQTSLANTLTFQSYVNGAGFGAQTPVINTGSSYSDDKGGSIAALATNFSVMQTIDITLHGKGDAVNYSSSTTLQQAVPEPSSLAIAGLGALGMIGYGLRRGKAQRV